MYMRFGNAVSLHVIIYFLLHTSIHFFCILRLFYLVIVYQVFGLTNSTWSVVFRLFYFFLLGFLLPDFGWPKASDSGEKSSISFSFSIWLSGNVERLACDWSEEPNWRGTGGTSLWHRPTLHSTLNCEWSVVAYIVTCCSSNKYNLVHC